MGEFFFHILVTCVTIFAKWTLVINRHFETVIFFLFMLFLFFVFVLFCYCFCFVLFVFCFCFCVLFLFFVFVCCFCVFVCFCLFCFVLFLLVYGCFRCIQIWCKFRAKQRSPVGPPFCTDRSKKRKKKLFTLGVNIITSDIEPI